MKHAPSLFDDSANIEDPFSSITSSLRTRYGDQPTRENRDSIAQLRNATAIERAFVERLYQRIGRPAVQIILWDGTTVGDPSVQQRRIVILNPAGLRRLLFDRVNGFAEGYTANEIMVKGHLIDVLTALHRGLSRVKSKRRNQSPWWSRIFGRHSLSASRSSVDHHYNIGNDFYRLWLDPQFVYTCAYYARPQATLEQAQIAKLDHVCRKLRLNRGDTVVEAGCGWGALALHMARNYGVKVRAFNLSREQMTFARERVLAEGLSDRVELIEDDYRNITGTYDAFVSVGMLEHVGAENYRCLGSVINRVLKHNGRGLIHSIGRNVACPLDTWTTKYIFPGAYAPCLREMMDLFEDHSFSVLDVENLRIHYAKTCADWFERFEQSKERVQQMFDARFVRMWRLYLAASSAAFQNGDLQLFQIVFTRPDNNTWPLTRADLYATDH